MGFNKKRAIFMHSLANLSGKTCNPVEPNTPQKWMNSSIVIMQEEEEENRPLCEH